ncbi:MAG: class I SAM-dependent methyltransferase [Actinomycetota bacterium]
MTGHPRDWNASEYDRLPIPMTRWGAKVVERLDLSGDERVLDAGCGTGQVTQLLRDRLPSGRVVALDASPSMIQAARTRLGRDRVEYLVHDLMEPIPIDPVDAVLSTATFHWIPDHERLFGNLAAVMRPGARLEAQCGGRGNIASVDRALRAAGHEEGTAAKTFAGPEETAARLTLAGFVDIECWLRSEPTPLPPDELEPYLATICLGGLIEGMQPDAAADFVHRVAGAMPESSIDYVRLEISATRA